MRLVWAQYAIEDREAVFDYLEHGNLKAAIRVDEQIAYASRQLMEFPESGRAGRVEGTRELVISRTPYIMVYISKFDTIRILRILHGARLWPPGPEAD